MPTERRRATHLSGGAQMALALAAAVGLVGCGEGVPAIDTTAAEQKVALLAAAGDGPLDACPIADADLLLRQILADVDDDSTDAALAGRPDASVRTAGGPSAVCRSVDPDTGVSVGLQLTDAPADGIVDPDTAPAEFDIAAQWASTANAYAGRFGDAPPALDTDELQDTRGGVLYEICGSDDADPARDHCELAWFGGDLVVSVTVTGAGADGVDLSPAIDPFRRRLQLVVDGFAAG